MASFFEKLKKGMGIEEGVIGEKIEETTEKPTEEKTTKKPERKTQVKKTKKIEVKVLKIEKEPEMEETEEIKEEFEEKELSPTKESKPSPVVSGTAEGKEKWLGLNGEPEGQLAIDVYQTENDLVIQSAIAGVKPEILDISMEKDVINIKGSRQRPFEENGDYFSQECFWGPFSREIILPADVDPNRAEATMKDGILTIRIPKILREKKRRIVVRG